MTENAPMEGPRTKHNLPILDELFTWAQTRVRQLNVTGSGRYFMNTYIEKLIRDDWRSCSRKGKKPPAVISRRNRPGPGSAVA